MPPRWLRFVAVVGAALLMPIAAGNAQVFDVYSINDVPVDATADSAVTARDQAIVQAQEIAYGHMLRRLTLVEDHPRLPPFDPARADELVRGYRIESEKTSTVRYVGVLTIEFKPEGVRQVLREADIRFAETASISVLLLPLFRDGDRIQLWGDDNPWRSAWGVRKPYWGLVPLVVPLGDLADLAQVDANEAVTGDAGRLAELASRYGAKDVVVAEAVLRPQGLQVTGRRYGLSDQGTVVARFAEPAGGDPAASMGRAVIAVARELDEAWKRRNLLWYGLEAKLEAVVAFANLGEWREVEKRLGEVPAVRKTDVLSVGRGQRRVQLSYIGSIDQLRLALAQSDLSLEQGAGLTVDNPAGSWTIRLGRAVGGQPDGPPGSVPPGTGDGSSPPAPVGTDGAPPAPATGQSDPNQSGTAPNTGGPPQ